MSNADTVVDVFTPARRAILDALVAPETATSLAERLNSTRQKVNYHLRALEAAGLVEVDELRPRRGLTERVMRRTSDVVLVDPVAFDSGSLERTAAVGLSGVVANATAIIGQAVHVAAVAADGSRVAAAVLDTEVRVASPSALRTMLDEIGSVIARHDSTTGLAVRVSTSVLPVVEPA